MGGFFTFMQIKTIIVIMKEIQILSYKIKPKQFSRFTMFVNKCICFSTGSDYWHTAIVIDGIKRESGHPYGAKKSLYQHYKSKYIDVQTLTVTEDQAQKMIDYADTKLRQNLRYNHYKLIMLAIFYPTRIIWDKIKWVPFSNDYFGMVCSVFVREILLAGGIDPIPHRYKELTAPGDFRRI